MTYLETLYYGIKQIAKRHNDIKGINTELAEYWIIKSDAPNIEMRLDFKSLCFELHLEFNSINDGFMIVNRYPDIWNKEYRNKDFIPDDMIYPNIALPLAFWRCDDEFFKKRYKRFDAITKRFEENA